MNGSILSPYVRRLPPAAFALGMLLVLSSCAGKAGQEQETPSPQQTPEVATAEPAQPQAAQPAPTPVNQPAAPAEPKVVDSAAVVKEFCQRIGGGIKSAIRQDSTPADPMEVVRKVTATVRDDMASIAVAKGATCR